MPAWSADVLKVERTTGGDVTRHQLRASPTSSPVFHDAEQHKRSLAITRNPDGKESWRS